MTKPIEVPPSVRQVSVSLARPKPMRRGSLSERFVKCSKPGCACAADLEARHGPYYSLTRVVAGKTQSRFLGPEQANMARQQIAAGQEFRKTVENYWRACEQWADQLLEAPGKASGSGVQKRSSKRSSRLRSSLKSNDS
jgi:hypothetical protein